MADRKKGKKKRWLIGAAIAVVAFAAVCAVVVNLAAGSIVEKDSVILLPNRTPYPALLDTLTRDNKINNIKRFERIASIMKLGDTIRPGRYVLRQGMNARQVAGMFRGGSQTPLNVTFNNIRTMEELAGRLGAQLRVDSAELAEWLLDDSVAADYGFSRQTFIAMFIPDTYQMYWTATPEKLLDRFKREYDRFWNDDRMSKLEKTGLSRDEVSTLASIIDEETNMTDEMTAIAGVYINRLRLAMPLQADPTVKFAVGDPTIKRVLHKHIAVDSPYNTYKHTGLPPGPIRMPSVGALDAVLNYRTHDYLYFCASPDFSGYHVFAKTLKEHNKNAWAYIKALDGAGIR